MEKSFRGQKHVCSNCNTKFFDFNKEKIICPNCKTEIVIQTKIINISDNLKINNEDKNINDEMDLSEEVEFDNEDDNIDEALKDESSLEEE